MKVRVFVLVLVAALVGTGSAFGQLRGGTVELNGFAGYLFGGGYGHGPADINNPQPAPYDVDIANDLNYGGRIGYNFNSLFELEFEYARTDTSFVRNYRFNNLPSQDFGELNIQYFMGYVTFNFGHSRWVPYFTIGGGVAEFDPHFTGVSTQSRSRATAAVGGGVKYFFNPHFALRFDGRAYSSDLGNRDFVCAPGVVCSYTNWVTNVVGNGGIIIAF